MALQMLPHIRMHPICGACGCGVENGERVVSILAHSEEYSKCTVLRAWYSETGFDMRNTHLHVVFCTRSPCQPCDDAPESATIHKHCFHLYVTKAPGEANLHNLWLSAIWRAPWKGSIPQNLTPYGDYMAELRVVADALGLRGLKTLPPEVSKNIHQLWQPGEEMWRYGIVESLALELSSSKQDTLVPIPFHRIQGWTRGRAPVFVPGNCHAAARYVCLTIDCRGLYSIERMSEWPSTGFKSDRFTFVVEKASTFRNMDLSFKLGLFRLCKPTKAGPWGLWDTSAPPSPDKCKLFPKPPPPESQTRFTTFNPQYCKGITLFNLPDHACAIHVHTHDQPDPRATYDQLTHHVQKRVTWQSIPFAAPEEIKALGARVHPKPLKDGSRPICLVIHLKMSEPVTAGPYCPCDDVEGVPVLGDSPTVIYGTSSDGSINTVGFTTPENSCHQPEVSWKPELQPPIDIAPIPGAAFSAVLLTGVSAVEVFTSLETSQFRGMFVYYADGTIKSLGSCRRGVDMATNHWHPTHICLKPHSLTDQSLYPRLGMSRPRMRVTSNGDFHSQHFEGGWSCFDMTVKDELFLQMYFTHCDSVVKGSYVRPVLMEMDS